MSSKSVKLLGRSNVNRRCLQSALGAVASVMLGISTLSAQVQSPGLIAQISAGGAHNCAIDDAGFAYCWGSGQSGQLGDGGNSDRAAPAVISLGSVAIQIAAGADHTCALLASGTVSCWGSNGNGQLGDETTSDRSLPTPVPGLNGVTQLALAERHTCALTSFGSVYCWGANDRGQLGDGTTISTKVPTLSSASGVASIAASGNHNCALTATGNVVCWGANSKGELGDASRADRTTPVAVNGSLPGVVAISAGPNYSCALVPNGVWCWGDGGSAQAAKAVSVSPYPVYGLRDGAVKAALGGNHSCVLTSVASVMCWGDNSYGQLGDAQYTAAFNSAAPYARVMPELSRNVSAISAGENHTCALNTSGAVFCWGLNDHGQLGNATLTNKSAMLIGVSNMVRDVDRLKTMVEFRYAPLDYYFMTSDDTEKSVLDGMGWSRTGNNFNVLANPATGRVGVSRFYFDHIAIRQSRGSHFYTVSDGDRAVMYALNATNLLAPRLPVNEGIDSYAYAVTATSGCATGQTPVYRVFRGSARFPDNPNHRFTSDKAVYRDSIALGWDDEGPTFCVPVSN